ncbi:AzlD domain-containing protein [Nonomuraea sp. H19]|uniref:AzlD domain-containing protein n=1 Tax=Nonomuraea sp. H19 TaxID=3452206 RepID=UPI003F8940A9
MTLASLPSRTRSSPTALPAWTSPSPPCSPSWPSTRSGTGATTLAALAVTIGLHLWRRNALLSILGGATVPVVLASAFSHTDPATCPRPPAGQQARGGQRDRRTSGRRIKAAAFPGRNRCASPEGRRPPRRS